MTCDLHTAEKTGRQGDTQSAAAVDLDAQREAFNGKWEKTKKHFLPRSLVQLLDPWKIVVLGHLQFCLSDENNRCIELGKNKRGLRQSIFKMARELRMSPASLKKIMKFLVDVNLVWDRKPPHGEDRSTTWLLNYSKMSKLMDMAEAFAQAPTLKDWQKWKSENTATMEKFSNLSIPWEKLEMRLPLDLTDPMETEPIRPDGSNGIGSNGSNGGDPMGLMNKKSIKKSIKKKDESKDSYVHSPVATAHSDDSGNSFSGDKRTKPAIQNEEKNHDAKPDRWVEFWATLPHVPKSKLGSQAYETCRKFFAAHRRYEAGQCRGFMLTKDIRERLYLHKINRKQKGAEFRSDEEMREHLEIAAKAFDPEYAPADKTKLGNLSAFLYQNGKFNGGYMGSRFLEAIAFPPRPLEDEVYDTLLENIEEHIQDIVDILEAVYNYANGRPHNQDLSLQEMKTAIHIAKNMTEEFLKIPRDDFTILEHFFPSYLAFVKHWQQWAMENVWEGMSISAFNTTKDFWRRFIDHVQADLGRDLFTGKRI